MTAQIKSSPRWWRHKRLKLQEAQAFVGKHHRHSKPLRRHMFSIGVVDYSTTNWDLIGVATVDNCSSAWSKDMERLEIRRVCTIGHRNLPSILINLATTACFSMGAEMVVSYTRPTESGASLKACGFALDDAKLFNDGTGRLRWINQRGQDKGKFSEYHKAKRIAKTANLQNWVRAKL